jgi:uncharacterized protein (TIGR03083 family)
MPAGTAVDLGGLRRIDHREAMRITATENARLLELLADLGPEDWTAPTDCTRWDVRAVALHLVASAHAQANPVEFARQAIAGRRHIRRLDDATHWVDGLNEAQLHARRDVPATALPDLWTRRSATALRARSRMPGFVRRLPLLPLGEALGTRLGWQPLAYLFDVGFTRDVWMHRVDIARATGRPLHLTADHDGRLIADVAAEWAIRHGEPVTLHLQGVAGGHYVAGGGALPTTLDAVQFCRILSGRAPGSGVLRHALPL